VSISWERAVLEALDLYCVKAFSDGNRSRIVKVSRSVVVNSIVRRYLEKEGAIKKEASK
jgi:hypothetical protein